MVSRNYKKGKKYPAIVITRPASGVKDAAIAEKRLRKAWRKECIVALSVSLRFQGITIPH